MPRVCYYQGASTNIKKKIQRTEYDSEKDEEDVIEYKNYKGINNKKEKEKGKRVKEKKKYKKVLKTEIPTSILNLSLSSIEKVVASVEEEEVGKVNGDEKNDNRKSFLSENTVVFMEVCEELMMKKGTNELNKGKKEKDDGGNTIVSRAPRSSNRNISSSAGIVIDENYKSDDENKSNDENRRYNIVNEREGEWLHVKGNKNDEKMKKNNKKIFQQQNKIPKESNDNKKKRKKIITEENNKAAHTTDSDNESDAFIQSPTNKKRKKE